MSAEIEIPDWPPWPAALAGGAGGAGRAQPGAVGAGGRPPGAGGGCARPVPRPRSGRRRPYLAGRSPPRSWPVVLQPDRAQCLGASEIRPASGKPCRGRAPSGHDGLGSTGTALTGATLGRRTVVPTVHSGGGGDAKGPSRRGSRPKACGLDRTVTCPPSSVGRAHPW